MEFCGSTVSFTRPYSCLKLPVCYKFHPFLSSLPNNCSRISNFDDATMTSPFVLPSPSGSYFVVINPNIDTLNAVPFADGSSDLLFAAFGQGPAMDFEVLLGHAQESLHLSITDCRRTWIVLRSDGTLGQLYRMIPSITQHARV